METPSRNVPWLWREKRVRVIRMVRTGGPVRQIRLFVAGVLAAAGTLVSLAAPAQAVATATITRSGSALVINAAAQSSTIYLGFSSSTFAVPTVTLRLPGNGFASIPDDCAADYPVGLPDQYVHCAAETVDGLDITFGPGNDTLYMDGACYPTINVSFGDGGNSMQSDLNCSTVISSTSGSGDDQIYFASGGGTASLGAGNDQFRGGVGAETVNAGPGNDSLSGSAGNDTLSGEDGNDAITGGAGNDVESGGNGDDVVGNYDDDQGADDVSGGPGVDKVWFNDHTGGGMVINLDDVANDGINGEGDNIHSDLEIIVGSAGDDTITGTAAPDNIDGHFGSDTIRGGAGNDRLDGNSDNDALFGGDGDDEIYGGSGNDDVTGDAGVDNLFGDYSTCCLNNGNDKIFAVDGVGDAINCGGGADSLEADQLDIVGGDGGQVCEAVTRTTVAPPPGTPGTPSAPGTPGAPGGPAAPGAPGAVLTVQAAAAGKATRAKGVSIATTCSAACSATVEVKVTKKVAKKFGLGKSVSIGAGKGVSLAAGKFTIKAKIKAKARKLLAKAGTVPVTIVLVVTDAAGARQTKALKTKLKP